MSCPVLSCGQLSTHARQSLGYGEPRSGLSLSRYLPQGASRFTPATIMRTAWSTRPVNSHCSRQLSTLQKIVTGRRGGHERRVLEVHRPGLACSSVVDACLLNMMSESLPRPRLVRVSPGRQSPSPSPDPGPGPNLANMDEKDKRLARAHPRPGCWIQHCQCVASHTPPQKTPGPVNQLTSGPSPLSRLELNPAAPALSHHHPTCYVPHRTGLALVAGRWPLLTHPSPSLSSLLFSSPPPPP